MSSSTGSILVLLKSYDHCTTTKAEKKDLEIKQDNIYIHLLILD